MRSLVLGLLLLVPTAAASPLDIVKAAVDEAFATAEHYEEAAEGEADSQYENATLDGEDAHDAASAQADSCAAAQLAVVDRRSSEAHQTESETEDAATGTIETAGAVSRRESNATELIPGVEPEVPPLFEGNDSVKYKVDSTALAAEEDALTLAGPHAMTCLVTQRAVRNGEHVAKSDTPAALGLADRSLARHGVDAPGLEAGYGLTLRKAERMLGRMGVDPWAPDTSVVSDAVNEAWGTACETAGC